MKKKRFMILGVLILIIILASLPTIIPHFHKYSFDQNKKIVTETKVVNADELWDLTYQQMEYRQKLDQKHKYSLIVDDIREGEYELNDAYAVIKDSPKMKFKISVPVTTYKDSDRTIEFISGNGKVLEVYQNGQWSDFNGSWKALRKKLQ